MAYVVVFLAGVIVGVTATLIWGPKMLRKFGVKAAE